MPFIINPYVFSGLDPAVVSYLTTDSSSTNSTSYSYSSQSFGAAAADRYIIAVIHTASGGTRDNSVTSCTIGGVSGTIVSQASGVSGSTSSHAAIVIAAVPTGTTGTVAFNVDEESNRSIIALYRATGLLSATPTATDTDTASPPSTSINVSAGGFVIAGMSGNNDPQNGSITNITEDVDSDVENTLLVSGHESFVSAQTGLALTGSFGNSAVAACMATAAFR